MKICAIGMFKNEADVIETYIRANSWLVDKFVLVNNMSTDNTLTILDSLINEGYDIEIIDDDKIGFSQEEKTKELLWYTWRKYSPDYIIPLDDDEIVSLENTGVTIEEFKKYMEKLPRNNLYYLKWRIYIPSEDDDPDELCVAKRQRFCFGDDIEVWTKILIPCELLKDGTFNIVSANHAGEGDMIENHLVLSDVRLAHYPSRSASQLQSKVLVGWTNYMSQPRLEEGDGAHFEILYKLIKEGAEINMDMLKSFATLYCVRQYDDYKIQYKPVVLPEESFVIKYTGRNEINVLNNYCNTVEKIVKKYVELLKLRDA